MTLDEGKGILTLNNGISIDLREYCESCYNHTPELVNASMIDQIRSHDNDKLKDDFTYVGTGKEEIIYVGMILSKVWESNKDKMNIIMDKNIISIN